MVRVVRVSMEEGMSLPRELLERSWVDSVERPLAVRQGETLWPGGRRGRGPPQQPVVPQQPRGRSIRRCCCDRGAGAQRGRSQVAPMRPIDAGRHRPAGCSRWTRWQRPTSTGRGAT